MANPERFNRQSFQEWANHPLTQVYRRFLKEQRDLLADQWARGLEMDSRSQAKALLLQELSTLNWADLVDQYRQVDEHAQRTAEADAAPHEDEESGS